MNINLIHKENPYNNFDYKQYPLDLQGWGSTDPNFKKLIDKINPKLIIEVGSWKGGSAIFMAEYIKEKKLDCKVLCIDTWLGAVEFLTNQNDPERYLSLGMKNGYPSVYYQFLANVMHKGLEDIIIPFPQTSILAARFLLLNNIKADMIYIDASHDEKDVYDDINNYWEILNIGGVVFGDDYSEHWPGVKSAVNDFVSDNELNISFTERQWVIGKENDTLNSTSNNIFHKARLNKRLALEYERDLFIAKNSLFHITNEKDQLNNDLIDLNKNNLDLENINAELKSNNIELEKKCNTISEVNSEIKNELSLYKNRSTSQEKEIEKIYASKGWKLLTFIRKIKRLVLKNS